MNIDFLEEKRKELEELARQISAQLETVNYEIEKMEKNSTVTKLNNAITWVQNNRAKNVEKNYYVGVSCVWGIDYDCNLYGMCRDIMREYERFDHWVLYTDLLNSSTDYVALVGEELAEKNMPEDIYLTENGLVELLNKINKNTG